METQGVRISAVGATTSPPYAAGCDRVPATTASVFSATLSRSEPGSVSTSSRHRPCRKSTQFPQKGTGCPEPAGSDLSTGTACQPEGFPHDKPNKLNKLLVYSGFICGQVAKVLLDGGASCNVISFTFAKQHGLQITDLASPVVPRGYDGQTGVPCEKAVRNARLRLGDLKDKVDLYVMDLAPEYDVILGKPWHAKHNPDIDWRHNIVTFKKPKKTVILHALTVAKRQATPELISNLQLKRTLNKRNGSPVFLAVITEDPPPSKLDQELSLIHI